MAVFNFKTAFFLFPVILLFLWGCGPSYKKDRYPSLPSGKLAGLKPNDVFSLLTERSKRLKVLKGEGNFVLIYNGEEIKGRGLILAENKVGFRLDILGPLFQPVYVFTYNDGLVSLLSMREKKLYKGFNERGRGVLQYAPTVPIPNPCSFLPFLFGEPPETLSPLKSMGVLQYAHTQDFAKQPHFTSNSTCHYSSIGTAGFYSGEVVQGGMDKIKNLYLIKVLSSAGFLYKMWIHPEKMVIVEGEIYGPGGALISTLKNDSFEPVDNVYFPKKITAVYADGLSLSVNFRKVTLMEKVKEGAFKLSKPSGVEEVPF